MADDRSVEVTVDAFLRAERERDEARAAVRAIAARCWMLRQVARESDTALRAEREEVRRLVTLVNDQRWELDRRDRAIARAEAAEAEVARLRVLTDVQRSVNETMTRLRHESVAERDAAIARAEAAEVAIAAVRALHVDSWQKGVCDVCETDYHMPCATIRALDAGATT